MLSRENSVRIILLPSNKGSTLMELMSSSKEQILFLKGRHFFRRGSLYRKPNRKSQKLSPLSEMAENLSSVPILLNPCPVE